MIKVSRLTKSFNGNKVLDDLSFEVAQGEIVAIMGSSGTGKSVLLLHLIGLMSPDSGTVQIEGDLVSEFSEAQLLKVRRHIGYLFQEGALYDFMTVAENLAFPLVEHTDLKPTQINDKINEFLALVDMKGVNEKYPTELSGGMRKRVALARAMILGTKVLLCDEPTSGLDPIRSKDISLLIRDLSKRMNCTTIITTHDVPNAFRSADRAMILNNGKIVANGKQDELMKSNDTFVKEFLA